MTNNHRSREQIKPTDSKSLGQATVLADDIAVLPKSMSDLNEAEAQTGKRLFSKKSNAWKKRIGIATVGLITASSSYILLNNDGETGETAISPEETTRSHSESGKTGDNNPNIEVRLQPVDLSSVKLLSNEQGVPFSSITYGDYSPNANEYAEMYGFSKLYFDQDILAQKTLEAISEPEKLVALSPLLLNNTVIANNTNNVSLLTPEITIQNGDLIDESNHLLRPTVATFESTPTIREGMHDDGTSIIAIEYIGIPVDVAYPVVSSDSTSTLNQNTGGYPLDDRQMNLTLQINRATGYVKRVTYFVEY